jgi:hypothetical protein
MKKPVPVESASALIDEKIKELGDWRGKTLARVRETFRYPVSAIDCGLTAPTVATWLILSTPAMRPCRLRSDILRRS